jgi:glycogen debranching enzyme
MIDALFRSGENDLAREIGSRFLHLVETSGFAENYDAITGAPLRDRAFAWTASTYLMLARDIGVRP